MRKEHPLVFSKEAMNMQESLSHLEFLEILLGFILYEPSPVSNDTMENSLSVTEENNDESDEASDSERQESQNKTDLQVNTKDTLKATLDFFDNFLLN